MHALIVGGSRADRLRAADAEEAAGSFRPAARLNLDASSLPFVRPDASSLPIAQPRLIRIDDLERAFPNGQTSGTRLVLTQSTYLLQKWIDLLGPGDRIVATADAGQLEINAPEMVKRRGPWRLFSYTPCANAAIPPGAAGEGAMTARDRSASPITDLLAEAFASGRSDERVTLAREAARRAPDSAVAALALASAQREVQDPSGARAALDAALTLAPDWEAAHFEDGKFWLACEDMERAREGFQRAADRMPTFSAAFSNLGATLGELDRPDEALAAFTHAASFDPDNTTILNNVGVVSRELGRLADSEAALARVTALAPEFVFGHYNLGHTRFLRGDYTGALAAYQEGQRRDPEKNRRQGCRLALVRFANGDLDGATRDFWRFADAAEGGEREDLLLEAFEIAQALLQAHPALIVKRAFVDRIAAELTL